MKKILKRHHISLKHASDGLLWAFTTQPNFKIHFILSLIAIVLSLYYHITRGEMIVIFFVILLGLVAEMINTALESMTDLITQEWREKAKIAKDVSAGMMLLTAIGAVVIAGIIFYPYIAHSF